MTSQFMSHRSFLRNSKSIYAKNKNNSKCVKCDTLDDEKHFLLHCPLYVVNRSVMLSSLIKLCFCKRDMTVRLLLNEGNCDDDMLERIETITQQFCVSSGRISFVCHRQDKYTS